MSYRLSDFDSGNSRNKGCFILLRCVSWKRESIPGKKRRVHVHLVCDTDIRGVCHGKKSTWGSRGYNISCMVLCLLEIVSFNGSLSFEIWVDIQGCGVASLVVLKVDSEDLEWNFNC